MTPRERVLAAVRHQTPDRCPMDFGGSTFTQCTPAFLTALRDELGFDLPDDRDPDGNWVDEQIQKYLDVDMRLVQYKLPLAVLKDLDPAEYDKRQAQRAAQADAPPAEPTPRATNALGEVVDRPDMGLIDAELDDVKKLTPKQPEPPKYMDWLIDQARGYREEGYAVSIFFTGGYFEWGCWARGFSQFCMDLMVNQDLVRALWDVWEQDKLADLEMRIKPLAPYVDLILSGDDFGMQNGPFMSPDLFNEMIVPYYKRLYGQVKAVAPDAYIMHHSCGSVFAILDGLIDMGVEVLNPLQPSAANMDPGTIKPATQGRLALHGGIDLQHLLPYGTPEEVKAEASRRMSVLGAGGGYICAAAHSLPADVPVANILSLFEADRSVE